MTQIHLKKSKCDKFGKGSDIILGRTLTPICPVSALVSYFKIRQESPGPFFVDSAKKPITKTFTQYMRELLKDIGLPHNTNMPVIASELVRQQRQHWLVLKTQQSRQ